MVNKLHSDLPENHPREQFTFILCKKKEKQICLEGFRGYIVYFVTIFKNLKSFSSYSISFLCLFVKKQCISYRLFFKDYFYKFDDKCVFSLA